MCTVTQGNINYLFYYAYDEQNETDVDTLARICINIVTGWPDDKIFEIASDKEDV